MLSILIRFYYDACGGRSHSGTQRGFPELRRKQRAVRHTIGMLILLILLTIGMLMHNLNSANGSETPIYALRSYEQNSQKSE